MPCDYSLYPIDWKTKIRPDILERDQHCCKVCKVPNYALAFSGRWNGIEVFQNEDGSIFKTEDGELISNSYVGDVWDEKNNGSCKIILTVAHLDHDIKNNDYSNLAALCQLHHNRHDVLFRKANRKKNHYFFFNFK